MVLKKLVWATFGRPLFVIDRSAKIFIHPQGVVKKTALKEPRFPAFGKSRLFFMPDRQNNYFG